MRNTPPRQPSKSEKKALFHPRVILDEGSLFLTSDTVTESHKDTTEDWLIWQYKRAGVESILFSDALPIQLRAFVRELESANSFTYHTCRLLEVFVGPLILSVDCNESIGCW